MQPPRGQEQAPSYGESVREARRRAGSASWAELDRSMGSVMGSRRDDPLSSLYHVLGPFIKGHISSVTTEERPMGRAEVISLATLRK